MTLLETLSFFIPELVLVIGAMALLIFGVFQGDRATGIISMASIGLLLIALGVTAAGAGRDPVALFDGAFRVDAFSAFAKIGIFAAASFAILMSDKYLAGEQLGRFEYPVLIVLSAFGMALMVSANDLIALYMGVETQSLALYILAAFNRDSRRSTEAGLKYFVLGALSSGLLLYGASLIYGFTGSTGFEAIAAVARAEDDNVGLVIGLVFLISGLAFKVSAAPFHMWTPDVYEGAPTPVTAFFAAAPKLAAMALFARALIGPFPEIVDDWRPIIAMIAVASMAIGSFSAIAQDNIKRLMAYSSIGHMGFALVALAAGTREGISAVLIYMAIYLIMTIGTFACILLMRRRGGLTESISDLAGMSETRPGLAILFTVLFFSLAGVPPTGGFFGKFFVFSAAVDAGLVWLAIVGVLMSAVAAFYYLRVIWVIWFNEAGPAFERDGSLRLGLTAAAAALIMLPVLLFAIAPLRGAADMAAAALFQAL